MIAPTLRQLTTFLSTVDSGSITSAARSLNLTQPAASQQLRELERILGVRLLDRARGKVIATPAGEALLAAARRAQSAVDDVMAGAARFRAGDVGHIRLGTGATACIYLLPGTLASVRRRMPKLAVTVATGNTPEILDQLEAGSLDIALVTLPISVSRSLVTTHIAVDPLLALVPEKLAPAGPTIGPRQLGRLPLILYHTGGNTRAIVDAWFHRAGLAAKPIIELGSVEAIKVLVASGLGASVLPNLALHDTVARTVVRQLRPALTRKLAYVLRKEKVMDRGLRILIEELGKVAVN